MLVLDRHEPARQPLDHRCDSRHDRSGEDRGRHLARGARYEREPAGLWLDIEADVGGVAAGCAVRLAEPALTLMWIYAADRPFVSVPQLLFPLGNLEFSHSPVFAAAGRFLAILQGEGGEITRIDFVLNWWEELWSKVPMAGM